MRFERKYKVEHLAKAVALQMVRNHPAGFRQIYPDRWINNVYFDTPAFRDYKDNVIGTPVRSKVRVRWYGDDPKRITIPILEIKAKQNELGTKKQIYFPTFDLAQLEDLSSPRRQLVIQKLNALLPTLQPLQPVLLNSYLRSYYGTSNKKFRLTIDTHLYYHSMLLPGHFDGYKLEESACIIELKYDEAAAQQADLVTQFIPFRQTKSSKYVTGVQMTLA